MAVTQSIYTRIFTPGDTIDITVSGEYLILRGTYAGFDVNSSITDGVFIKAESRCTFSSAVTFTDDKVVMETGAKTTFAGGITTLAGDKCALRMGNDSESVGVLMSGQYGTLDGGGKDTVIDGTTLNHAIEVTGNDCIVRRLTAQTDNGMGNSYSGVSAYTAERCLLVEVKIQTSDDDGIVFGTNSIITFCHTMQADAQAVQASGAPADGCICANNILTGGGSTVTGYCTDSIFTDNILHGGALNRILLTHVNATNNLVVCNRIEDTTSDVDSNGTIFSNNLEGAI